MGWWKLDDVVDRLRAEADVVRVKVILGGRPWPDAPECYSVLVLYKDD